MTDNTPIIVFARSAQERDLLRGILGENGRRILFFESETTCFDNLASIQPGVVVVRTDSRIIAWRFVFALHLLRINAHLVILSNVVNEKNFVLHGSAVKVQSFSTEMEKEHLNLLIEQYSGKLRTARAMPLAELFVGETAAAKNINAMLPCLAKSSDPVLITGQSGTGKELLARMIVQQAGNQSIFVKLDCETIQPEGLPKGLLVGNAEGDQVSGLFRDQVLRNTPATILLHKIDRLNETTQSEVLLLMEGRADHRSGTKDAVSAFRIIATSEVDLSDMVRRRCFRKDLYYRLNVLPIYLPPLQRRKDDIPLLMDYFIISSCAKLNRCFSIPSGWSRKRIMNHHWPGNVDELKSAMNRFVVSGDEAQIFAHFGSMPPPASDAGPGIYQLFEMETTPDPMEIQSCFRSSDSLSLKSICDRFASRTEKKLMRKALESTNWNRKKAAALLNISYKSMLNKMKMYEIV